MRKLIDTRFGFYPIDMDLDVWPGFLHFPESKKNKIEYELHRQIKG